MDTVLVERTLLIGLIEDAINRIYYLLLATLTDSYVATSSAYWHEFGMSSADVVFQSIVDTSGATVVSDNYVIQPPAGVVSHWESFSTDITVGTNDTSRHRPSSVVPFVHISMVYVLLFILFNETVRYYENKFF